MNIPPSDPANAGVAIGDIDQNWAIAAGSTNPDAAAAYIKSWSDVESQECYAYSANYIISTNTPLDESKFPDLYIEVNTARGKYTTLTPWFDRMFGAGEGVEWNNAAQAIIAGKDPTTELNELQQFAIDNALR